MVTYYQGRSVLVTHDLFESTWPDPLSLRIEDLYDVHITCGGASGRHTARVFAIPAGLLIVAIASWSLVAVSPGLRATLLLAATVGLLIAFYRRARPLWVLHATYLGGQIELYSSTDVQTFGQIKRALIRALESNAR